MLCELTSAAFQLVTQARVELSRLPPHSTNKLQLSAEGEATLDVFPSASKREANKVSLKVCLQQQPSIFDVRQQ